MTDLSENSGKLQSNLFMHMESTHILKLMLCFKILKLLCYRRPTERGNLAALVLFYLNLLGIISYRTYSLFVTI